MDVKPFFTFVLIVSAAFTYFGCAVAPDSGVEVDPADRTHRGTFDDPALEHAVDALLEKDPETANRICNAVLNDNPRSAPFNLLNGMAYHSRAVGEGYYWGLAKVGYLLTWSFAPHVWQAPYMIGVMNLKERDLSGARRAFSEAVLAAPFHPDPLYGLAAAAYAAGDSATALPAVAAALHLDPAPGSEARRIAALCHAAAGEFQNAEQQLSALRSLAPREARRVQRRINHWQKYHTWLSEFSTDRARGEFEPDSRTPDAVPPGAPEPRMALLEVIIIRHAANNSDARGVNLLEGLSLQFEGTLINLERERVEEFDVLTTDTYSKGKNLKLSVPAVEYTLNIVNSADSTSRVLARPSVLALDGETSEFFIGGNWIFLTGGDYDSVVERDVGLRLKATPTFYTDRKAKLRVETELSALEGGVPVGELVGINTEKANSKVSAVMQFGETLAVSTGLSYREQYQQSGVPILNKTPLLDNFASTRQKTTDKSSLLILLSLRAPASGAGLRAGASEPDADPMLRQRIIRYIELVNAAPIPASPREKPARIPAREALNLSNPEEVLPFNPVSPGDNGKRRRFIHSDRL